MSFSCERHALWLVFIAFSTMGCESPIAMQTSTGGGYAPVTYQQLVGKTCTNRTGREDGNFTWVFKEDRFVIEGDNLPVDLVETMLGPGATADRIEGVWEIQDGAIYFVVPNDATAPPRRSSLPIFFTGVIRIQSPEAQYVF
jgi:hypothetical protein